MACSAKELEEDVFASDDEDVLSQRLTEMASSFGSSDDLQSQLRPARGQAGAEESGAPSSAAELHRRGFGHLACFANEFAATMPVRILADVPAPTLLSRTCPLPPISRRRPGEIQLPGSRSSSRFGAVRLLSRFGMSEYYGSEGFDRPPSDVYLLDLRRLRLRRGRLLRGWLRGWLLRR